MVSNFSDSLALEQMQSLRDFLMEKETVSWQNSDVVITTFPAQHPYAPEITESHRYGKRNKTPCTYKQF